MIRPGTFAALLLLTAFLATARPLQGQSGMRDRYFLRYPFEKWKAETPVSQVKWTPKVQSPRLSTQQRLNLRVETLVDAKETEKRRGRGELVVLLELTDSEGRRWRSHEVFDLAQIPAAAKASPLIYTQNALVLPGDYRICLAVLDSQTLEHSFLSRTVHVGVLRNDSLPDAWKGLPAVEFSRNYEPPDMWFQPYLRGRLNLPVTSARPVHIDVIMNLTPSDRGAGSVRVFRRNMGVLVPALKVLGGLSVKAGSLDVTVMDLTGRKTWNQLDAHGALDWRNLREPFASATPGIVDVQALAAKAQMRHFFRDVVLEKLKVTREAEPLHAVIVLSAPISFDSQRRFDPETLPKDPSRRLFYISYRALNPARALASLPEGAPPPPAIFDELEPIMKSLDGRVFNVVTPEDFRRATAAILAEISRL